jgi:hypothetical protein
MAKSPSSMLNRFPILRTGSYSGTSQTYQLLAQWVIASEWGRVFNIHLQSSVSLKARFKINIGGYIEKDIIPVSLDTYLPLGATKLESDLAVSVYGCSADGTDVSVFASIIGIENIEKQKPIPKLKRR